MLFLSLLFSLKGTVHTNYQMSTDCLEGKETNKLYDEKYMLVEDVIPKSWALIWS